MADVNAIINIDINSSSALVNLKRLESQIDQFNRSVSASNATAAASQQSLNKALLDGINNTGLFTSKIVPVESSMKRFSTSLDEGRLSLGEYTRYAGSQLPGLSRVFRREFDSIEQVATSRVKSIQTQYLALGKTVDGVTRTIASTPTGLARGMATDLAITQQRQQIFNKLLDDGSTKLLNWGKNTQWAGRQLMVGFSLPLAAFGAAASKTFMEIDKATISLKRVYGDLSTTREELNSNVEAVKGLGKEYTKYGITLAETISLSARAAATGATNEQLMAATEQTLRFATLGQMDYNQALDTTISLQTAFAISNEDLGKTVDYLNAVENQTILTMEDMSLAIPRVATVVKGLGGSVEDLAVMMTAMREGGVSAENAANGLKSGLASLINPTKRASESLASMGVNLNQIITQNKGDLMGIITEFGMAINKLDEFSRQQVLEQVFGKYQYARMSALFTNITKDAGQAARAMDIAAMSAADLAKISEKELGQISESTSVKFQASMEQLKVSIAPIGEAFLKGITPIVDMVSKIADAFNNLPDGVKNAIAVLTGVVAGIGPVLLMTIGLLGNGIANITKFVQFIRKSLAGIKGDASAFTYLAQGELEATTASKALEGSAVSLTDKLLLQRGAVSGLTAEYERFARAAGLARAEMGSMSGAPVPSGGGRAPVPTPRIRRNTGGTIPGVGSTDTVPAMLTPGEFVINKTATAQNLPLLHAINDGQAVGGFNKGGQIPGVQYFGGRIRPGGQVERIREKLKSADEYLPPLPVAKGPSTFLHLIKEQGLGGEAPDIILALARALGTEPRRMSKVGIDIVSGRDINRRLNVAESGSTPTGGHVTGQEFFEAIRATQASNKDPFKKIKKLNPDIGQAIEDDLIAWLRNNPTERLDDSRISNVVMSTINDAGITEEARTRFLSTGGYRLTRGIGFSKINEALGRGTIKRAWKEGKRHVAVELENGRIVSYETRNVSTSGGINQTGGKNYREFDNETLYEEWVKAQGRTIEPLEFNEILRRNRGGQIPRLNRGGKFLGMPQKFNPKLEQELQTSTRLAQSGPGSQLPLSEFATLEQGIGGYSAAFPGLNGIYADAAGRRVVYKSHPSFESAEAEMLSGRLMSSLFGLESPSQVVVKRKHPVTGDIIFGVESAFDSKFAISETVAAGSGRQFTPSEAARQFIASGIRRDRDLRPANIRGNLVVDQGAAVIGVNDSGAPSAMAKGRSTTTDPRSVAEQLSVNAVMTKSGAQKFLADNLADVARSVGPEEFERLMVSAVSEAKGKLHASIDSLPTSESTKNMYRSILTKDFDELQATSWRSYYDHLESFTVPVARQPTDAALKKLELARQESARSQASRDAAAQNVVSSRLGLPTAWARGIFRNTGGPIFESQTKIVPGVGSTDTVPAMLTPGEFVINKEATRENLPLLHAINDGKMINRNKGGQIPGMQYFATPNPQRVVQSQNELNYATTTSMRAGLPLPIAGRRQLVLVDLDGTIIGNPGGTLSKLNPEDFTPIEKNISRIRELRNQGIDIEFVTARPPEMEELTRETLRRLGLDDIPVTFNDMQQQGKRDPSKMVRMSAPQYKVEVAKRRMMDGYDVSLLDDDERNRMMMQQSGIYSFFNKGGQIPGMQYFATPNPQRVVQKPKIPSAKVKPFTPDPRLYGPTDEHKGFEEITIGAVNGVGGFRVLRNLEGDGSKVTLQVGKHHPFHKGHEDLLKIGIAQARDNKSDFIFSSSAAYGNQSDNPLNPVLKRSLIQEATGINPNMIGGDFTLNRMLEQLVLPRNNDNPLHGGGGYTKFIESVGSDRINHYNRIANKFFGKENTSTAEITERITSGTALRQLAMDNNFEEFSRLLPDSVSEKTKRKVYEQIKTYEPFRKRNEPIPEQFRIQGYSLGGKVRLPFAKKKDPKELFRDPYLSEGSVDRDKDTNPFGLTRFGEPIREDWNDVLIRLGKEAKLSGDTGWRERLIKEYDLPFDIKERLQREGGTYKRDSRDVAHQRWFEKEQKRQRERGPRPPSRQDLADKRWFEEQKAKQSKIRGYALGGPVAPMLAAAAANLSRLGFNRLAAKERVLLQSQQQASPLGMQLFRGVNAAADLVPEEIRQLALSGNVTDFSQLIGREIATPRGSWSSAFNPAAVMLGENSTARRLKELSGVIFPRRSSKKTAREILDYERSLGDNSPQIKAAKKKLDSAIKNGESSSYISSLKAEYEKAKQAQRLKVQSLEQAVPEYENLMRAGASKSVLFDVTNVGASSGIGQGRSLINGITVDENGVYRVSLHSSGFDTVPVSDIASLLGPTEAGIGMGNKFNEQEHFMFNKGGQIPRVQYAITGQQITKLSRGLKPGQLGRYLDENNLIGGLTPEQHQQVLDFDASVSQSSRSTTRNATDRSRTYRDDPRRVANLNENGMPWRGRNGNLTGDIRPYSEMDMKNKLSELFMQDPDTHRRRFSEWVETTPMRRGDYQLAKELENYYMQGFNNGGQIPQTQKFAFGGMAQSLKNKIGDLRTYLNLRHGAAPGVERIPLDPLSQSARDQQRNEDIYGPGIYHSDRYDTPQTYAGIPRPDGSYVYKGSSELGRMYSVSDVPGTIYRTSRNPRALLDFAKGKGFIHIDDIPDIFGSLEQQNLELRKMGYSGIIVPDAGARGENFIVDLVSGTQSYNALTKTNPNKPFRQSEMKRMMAERQKNTQRKNTGGPIFESQSKIVPGVGSTDTVPAMLTPGEFVINKQSTRENLPLLHAINNGQVLNRNKGGQIPGMQYFATPNPQRIVQPLSADWRSKLKLKQFPQTYDDFRNTPNILETIYAVLKNPFMSKIAKESAGRRRGITRSIFDYVHNPGQLDERKISDSLRWFAQQSPDLPLVITPESMTYGGNLYRGTGVEDGMFPEEMQRAMGYAASFPKTGINGLQEFIGSPFAVEARSWSKKEKVAERFAYDSKKIKVTLEGSESTPHRGLDVQKMLTDAPFKEGEFIPIDEFGERVVLRIKRVEEQKINNKNKLHVILERATDISDKERKEAISSLEKRIVEQRGSVAGKKSRKNKKQQKEEILAMTGVDGAIRDDILSLVDRLNRGERFDSYEKVDEVKHLWQSKEAIEIGRKMYPFYDEIINWGVQKSGKWPYKSREVRMIGANAGGVMPNTTQTLFRNAGGPIFESQSKIVPGVGNTDTVPAMLTPGEFVINKQSTKENLPLLHAINSGQALNRNTGGMIPGMQYFGTLMPQRIVQQSAEMALGRAFPKIGLTEATPMADALSMLNPIAKAVQRRLGKNTKRTTKINNEMDMLRSEFIQSPEGSKVLDELLKSLESKIDLPGVTKPIGSDKIKERIKQTKLLEKIGLLPSKKEIVMWHSTSKPIPNDTLNPELNYSASNRSNLKGVGFYGTERRELSSTYLVNKADPNAEGSVQYAYKVKAKDYLNVDNALSSQTLRGLKRQYENLTASSTSFPNFEEILIAANKLSKTAGRKVTSIDDLRQSIFDVDRGSISSQKLWVDMVKGTGKKGIRHTGGDFAGDGSSPHTVTISYDSVPIKRALNPQEELDIANFTRTRNAISNEYFNTRFIDDALLPLANQGKLSEKSQLLLNRIKQLNEEKIQIEKTSSSINQQWSNSEQRQALTYAVESNLISGGATRLNAGGTIPGVGNTDKVPAMLTPGEFVINKQATQSNLSLLHAINDGNTPQSMQGFNKGGQIPGIQYFADGGLPQSGYYGAPPQIKKQTRNMPEWSTQNAEMLAARQAAEAFGATTEQIGNNLNRVAAHLIEGQGDIKYWVANNLMTDLQAINQYMNRVPKVAQTILNDTQMIDDVARRTGLSSSKVAEELDLLVKRVHPSTIEAASVLRHLSELDAQASLAVQQARQSGANVSKKTSFGTNSDTGYLAAMTAAALGERIPGDFYDTRGDRAYSTPEGGYQTYRGGTAPLPTPMVEEFKGVPADLSNKERKELRAQVQEEVKNSPVSQYASAADRKKLEDQIYERRLIEENHKKRSRLIDEEVSFLEERGVSHKKALKIAEKTVDDDRAGIAKQKAEQRFDRKYAVVPVGTQSLPIVPPNLDPEMDMETPSVGEGNRRSGRGGGIKQKIGSGLMKSGGAISMLSMFPFMMQNEEGKFMGMDANMLGTGMMVGGMAMPAMGSAIGAMGGGGALAAMAPILGPIALGAAAVGVGLMIWRKSVDNAAKETAKLGANMGGTANALNNMATLLGTSTPTQRQAQMQLGFTAEQQQQAASQFQPIFESEAGQKFVKDLESATSADRFKKLSDYLKAAIASGMMDTQSANLFAKTIGSVLSDPILGQSIIKSISGQKTGGAAMLGLAQKRESGVVAGGQLKVLGANQTVEEGTASSVIGSSIQLIQDFSNASALAKEELVAGTISYSRYKEIIDQSTAAQEKYTQAINDSFNKTQDFGSTLQAWKDQLVLSGKSEDVVSLLEGSATTTTGGGFSGFLQASISPGTSIEAIGKEMLSGQTSAAELFKAATTGEVSTINKDLISAVTAASIEGKMSDADIAKVATEINTNKEGKIAKTFAKTKDLNIAALEYNIQQGAIPELAISNQLRLQSQAVAAPRAAAAAQEQIQRRQQGQEAYKLAAEKFTGAGFGIPDLEQIRSMVGSPNVIDLSFQLSGMSDTEIKDTVISTQRLNELIGPEGSTKIMDIFVNENPPNIDKRLPEITASIKDLMKIPDDVQKKLGIDTTSVGDVDKWGPMADEIANLSTILNTMPEGVRGIGIDLMIDANGKPLTIEEYGKASRKIIKAYKDLASGDSEIKKKAIITLMQETKDATGKTLSLEESQQAYGDLIDTYGKGKITKLPPDILTKVIDLRVDIEGLDVAIKSLDGMIALNPEFGKNELIRSREKLMQLKDEALTSESTTVEAGLNLTQEGTKSGGGSNPLLDFKKSLLEQIRLYADLSMTLKKLFSSKMSFLKLLGSNKGIDDQLRAAGLGEAATQAVMSMGADAAKKWIKANISGGKLKESGKKQEEALLAGAMSQRQSEAVGAIKTANVQEQASKFLASGRFGKAGAETTAAILGDPMQAEGYVKAVKEYIVLKKKVDEFKGKTLPEKLKEDWKIAQKGLFGYINTQDKAFKRVNLQEQLQIADNAVADKIRKGQVKTVLATKNISQSVKDAILNDANLTNAYLTAQQVIDKGAEAPKGKKGKDAREKAKEARAEQIRLEQGVIAGLGDPRLVELQDQLDKANKAKEKTDKDYKAQTDPLIERIRLINKEIDAIQELNSADQNRIRTLSREKELLERQVDAINRKNEADQKSIDRLQREDELRTRVADALNHELSIMSEKETKIREAYDKRVKALDEVAKINDYIINQQKSQLGLADALSRGDISAAAGIQQEMQAGNAQFATQEMRTGLQTGMENQVAGLTTSGGLTRVQAEDQIRAIGEQTYQTSLLVRDLQDAIYGRNLEIATIKIQQRDVDDSILKIQDDIYDRETKIIGIQTTRLEPLQKALTAIEEQKIATDNVSAAIISGLEYSIANFDITNESIDATNALAKEWEKVGQAIAAANDEMNKKTGKLGGKPPEAPAGSSKAVIEDYRKKREEWQTKYDKIISDNKAATDAAMERGRVAGAAIVAAPVVVPVTTDLGVMDFSGFDFSKIDFSGLNFAGMSPTGAAAGGVMGTGGRDSIPAMLTPGEFVMRKASVQKYGTAMLERMNMGSFNMPRYNVQETGMSAPITSTSNNTSINAPVYNTYSVNVNVPNTNADPSMIADKVIMRIGQIDNANIRSLRGNK